MKTDAWNDDREANKLDANERATSPRTCEGDPTCTDFPCNTIHPTPVHIGPDTGQHATIQRHNGLRDHYHRHGVAVYVAHTTGTAIHHG